MRFPNGGGARVCKRHVVLAPRSAKIPNAFSNVADNPDDHQRMLNEMQRLRGRILFSDGAIQASGLSADGRDASPIDDQAWHLLALDEDGAIAGCLRMLVHPCRPQFEGLMVSRTALAKCPERGVALRSAVESELKDANATGVAVVEVGGWMLTESMRCSTEAVHLALGAWAWGRLLGGAVGFATATIRNHSANILGRIGGSPLQYCGEPIGTYFEPKYDCDIQILRFDTSSYSRRYAPLVDSIVRELMRSPVVTATEAQTMPLHTRYSPIHSLQPDLAFA